MFRPFRPAVSTTTLIPLLFRTTLLIALVTLAHAIAFPQSASVASLEPSKTSVDVKLKAR